MADLIPKSKSYLDLLTELKEQIRNAQVRAAVAINSELVLLYWNIGKQILARQSAEGWGRNVIPRLSKDLTSEFPQMKGLSPRNLGYMKAFAEAWPDDAILQQAAAKLPWFHNCVILDKIKVAEERLWYVQAAIQNGWSRNVLVLQIESGLYARTGKAVTNFDRRLPKADSDLAAQLIKDPYNFDFLTLAEDARERELESGLLAHLQRFLLELGSGFAFMGRQVRLEVGGEEFFVDLLFYHVKLRCYVVIDLKMTAFKPEYSGKMNFYLAAVDDMMRHADDKPSIGLILCKAKNRLVAEYALRGTATPMGVAEFKLLEKLPDQLKGSLPTIDEIEAELAAPDGSDVDE